MNGSQFYIAIVNIGTSELVTHPVIHSDQPLSLWNPPANIFPRRDHQPGEDAAQPHRSLPLLQG